MVKNRSDDRPVCLAPIRSRFSLRGSFSVKTTANCDDYLNLKFAWGCHEITLRDMRNPFCYIRWKGNYPLMSFSS